jgi:calcium-translocating P-type ATPase
MTPDPQEKLPASPPRPADAAAWHALDRAEVEAALGSGPQGLSAEEVRARLERHGPNQLEETEPISNLAILLHQFKSPLIYILLIAAVVTAALGEFIDTGVIAAVLLLNAIVGFTQERKAEVSVRALMQLVQPHAHVVRDGGEMEIESRELVPGDLVLLESGSRVPADLRLVAATALSIDESLLTGESLPAAKQAVPVKASLVVADRTNMAFAGTAVARGRGRGYVVTTGSRTVLGRIAERVRGEERAQTPLQQRMTRFAHFIGVAVGLASVVAFAMGVILGASPADMFRVAVAMAVAAVPEGLPVVFTIALAVGVRRMAARQAIIRRLPAVETLGSTTVIGSDKTGTLTENRMTVQELWVAGRTFQLPSGGAQVENSRRLLEEHRALHLALVAGVVANEADLQSKDGDYEFRGDPTEVALLVAAERFGLAVDEVRRQHAAVAEIPFESDRQFSASIRRHEGRNAMFVKGAPERVVAMCRWEREADREAAVEAAAGLASRGLRTLAMAWAELPDPPPDVEELEEPDALTFLGLAGMMDPPRAGVREAIAGCQEAGIRVVMITGDHALTGKSIGRQLGIAQEEDTVLTGGEMAAMDEAALRERVGKTSIYARVAPEQKLRVVRALQHSGEVVAVTGDGVNDAPALKAAAIGIAMGKSGTDVAREASDMVLADDNFVSIYAAVEEGRVTFDNLRKVTFFLISTGAAAVLTILASLALGWPLPFLPAQLLWLNLVTNGLQDVALAFEPGEEGVLRRPPRSAAEGVISSVLWERTAVSGVVMAIGTLVLFQWELAQTGSLARAQTVALTTMVLFQAFQAGNARSEHGSLLGMNPFSNRFLFVAVFGALLIHAGALYWGPTQFILRVEPVDGAAWLRMAAVATSILLVVEVHKWLRRSRRPLAQNQEAT